MWSPSAAEFRWCRRLGYSRAQYRFCERRKLPSETSAYNSTLLYYRFHFPLAFHSLTTLSSLNCSWLAIQPPHFQFRKSNHGCPRSKRHIHGLKTTTDANVSGETGLVTVFIEANSDPTIGVRAGSSSVALARSHGKKGLVFGVTRSEEVGWPTSDRREKTSGSWEGDRWNRMSKILNACMRIKRASRWRCYTFIRAGKVPRRSPSSQWCLILPDLQA